MSLKLCLQRSFWIKNQKQKQLSDFLSVHSQMSFMATCFKKQFLLLFKLECRAINFFLTVQTFARFIFFFVFNLILRQKSYGSNLLSRTIAEKFFAICTKSKVFANFFTIYRNMNRDVSVSELLMIFIFLVSFQSSILFLKIFLQFRNNCY